MALCFEFLIERRIILCLPFQLLSVHCLPKLEALILPLQVLNMRMYQEASSVCEKSLLTALKLAFSNPWSEF